MQYIKVKNVKTIRNSDKLDIITENDPTFYESISSSKRDEEIENF